jgi:homocysteine S-methyltransferase
MLKTAASGRVAESLSEQPFLVLDGGLATELERRGADLRDPLWSAKLLIEAPEMVRAVHRDYLRAGADIVTTATYQATFEGFERRGIAPEPSAALMRSAVVLARDARDEFWAEASNRRLRGRPLVAASVGPYGAMLADGSEYRGRYGVSDAALADFHRPRLEILAAGGADLIACETLPCLREALVLARLLEEFPLGAWISFSCRDGAHNAEGERVSDCAAALRGHPRLSALGVNCTPPRYVMELLQRMREHADRPLIAYPNSGENYDARAKRWMHTAERGGTAECPRFADSVLEWYRAGARLIGGCCRTTPEDVSGIRAQLGLVKASMI